MTSACIFYFVLSIFSSNIFFTYCPILKLFSFAIFSICKYKSLFTLKDIALTGFIFFQVLVFFFLPLLFFRPNYHFYYFPYFLSFLNNLINITTCKDIDNKVNTVAIFINILTTPLFFIIIKSMRRYFLELQGFKLPLKAPFFN